MTLPPGEKSTQVPLSLQAVGQPVVVLTRPAGDNQKLAQLAQAHGAQVVELPCIATQAVAWTAGHLQAVQALASTQALVFASPKAAAGLHQLLLHAQTPLPSAVRCFAVGPATAAAVERCLQRPAQVAKVHSGAGLLACLQKAFDQGPVRLLLPAAQDGRTELQQGLQQAGHVAVRLPVYATLPAPARSPQVTWDGRVHYIVCTSPSGVAGFWAQATLPAQARFVSIGPTTSRALRARGQAVFAEAAHHDLAGLQTLLASVLRPLELP